jgi:signal transduction histidine kinase
MAKGRVPGAKPHDAVLSNRSLWTIGTVLIIATLFGAALTVLGLRRQVIADYRTDMANLGVVLTEQTTRYVQVVDFALRDIEERSTALAVASPEQFSTAFGSEQTHDFLRERVRNLPQAGAVMVIDAAGRMLNYSYARPVEHIDVSDRDYYRHFLLHDDPGVFVSEPTQGRIAGTMRILLTRRINGPGHVMLGLVIGAIEIADLVDFYRAINLPAGEAVTLLRHDGLVLARHPDTAQQVGLFMPVSSPWHAVVAANGGSYRSPGFIGGGPSVVSVHPLKSWPLVIDVSIQEQVALARWARWALVIVSAGVGAAFGLFVLFAVITWQFRRQAEQNATLAETADALRASEARVRDFAEMSSDWFWEQDADLRYTQISGSSPSQYENRAHYLGRTRWELVEADPASAFWAAHIADLNARRPFRNLRYQRSHGTDQLHHVCINGNPVFDSAGIFIGYRGTGREVTAEVEAARELQLAKERAEAANRTKSEFLANMSHELRTPLNAVIGFSELIRDQPFGKIGMNYVEYATDINSAGRHLLDVINDVLDLSKIEAGRYELVEEMLDLAVVVRACVGMLKPRANEGDIRIDNATAQTHVALHGDRRAVKQIVLNLLSNAVKFTPRGGLVSLGIEQEPNGVALVVADTGVGIEADALVSLCEPFRQADASISRKFGGSGLGLAISRRLLALHGGTLTIESTPGQGTTVRATFPCERIVRTPTVVTREIALLS